MCNPLGSPEKINESLDSPVELLKLEALEEPELMKDPEVIEKPEVMKDSDVIEKPEAIEEPELIDLSDADDSQNDCIIIDSQSATPCRPSNYSQEDPDRTPDSLTPEDTPNDTFQSNSIEVRLREVCKNLLSLY